MLNSSFPASFLVEAHNEIPKHMPKIRYGNSHSSDCHGQDVTELPDRRRADRAGTKGGPGQSPARILQARAVSHLQSEAGVLCPAAIPGGRSAALCRQEELTADCREDPAPAGGRQASGSQSPTERARRFQAAGRREDAGASSRLWS